MTSRGAWSFVFRAVDVDTVLNRVDSVTEKVTVVPPPKEGPSIPASHEAVVLEIRRWYCERFGGHYSVLAPLL